MKPLILSDLNDAIVIFSGQGRRAVAKEVLGGAAAPGAKIILFLDQEKFHIKLHRKK